MEHAGYAIVPIDDGDWSDDEPGIPHVTLTDRLGCSDTKVDVYRTRADATVPLPSRLERLCVPIEGHGALTVEGTHPLRGTSIALVLAGADATIGSEEAATWLVVSAPADPPKAADPAVVDVRSLDFAAPSTSDVPTARLTDRLGSRGTKVNVRRLEPGAVVPYHTEGSQEELFVPLDGDGTVRVDGETYAVPRGSVTRVAPELPRSAVNAGDADTLWLMVGAPPTGAADEWDPGAENHEWPGPD